MATEVYHKLKVTGTELDSRLDQIKANESKIQDNAEALAANAAADAELKAMVEGLVIPTKTSELENDAKFITAEDVDTSDLATKDEIKDLASKAELEDYAKKEEVSSEISAATTASDSSAEIEALKAQLSALSDYVAENIEAQVVQDVPEDESLDVTYSSQNVTIKGTHDVLEMTVPVSVVANSVVVKNVSFPTKNTQVKLTAKS